MLIQNASQYRYLEINDVIILIIFTRTLLVITRKRSSRETIDSDDKKKLNEYSLLFNTIQHFRLFFFIYLDFQLTFNEERVLVFKWDLN